MFFRTKVCLGSVSALRVDNFPETAFKIAFSELTIGRIIARGAQGQVRASPTDMVSLRGSHYFRTIRYAPGNFMEIKLQSRFDRSRIRISMFHKFNMYSCVSLQELMTVLYDPTALAALEVMDNRILVIFFLISSHNCVANQ